MILTLCICQNSSLMFLFILRFFTSNSIEGITVGSVFINVIAEMPLYLGTGSSRDSRRACHHA
jgi:hypothetical protein